jgi:hypothetical protein
MTTAIGIGAGAGAAQLGLGYGLGIVAWLPSTETAGQNAWLVSLAWVVWLAGTSAAIGAICADRLSTRVPSTVEGGRSRTGHAVDFAWRVVIALAAAIGALITVPLVAVPARAALRGDNFVPQVTAAGYAVVGVIVGVVVAIGAVSARAVARNVIATVAWLWTLAVIAVVDGVRGGDALGTAQLAVWDFTHGHGTVRGIFDWPSTTLMLGSALVIGALAAWLGTRRGDGRVGVAVSGGFGPLLVAAAYFLTAPRMLGVDAKQLSAFLIAPYAVLTGLAGSVLVTALTSRGRGDSATTGEPTTEADGALADWARSLSDVDMSDRDGDDDPVGAGSADRTEDLSKEAYGSARSYGTDPGARAYATDSGDVDTSGAGIAAVGTARPAKSAIKSTTTGTGRAAVKDPLWPESAKPASGRRSGRRGDPPKR